MRLVAYTAAPWDHALTVLRYRAPADALEWNVLPGKEGLDKIYPERVAQADVVLIQRDFPRFYPAYREVLDEARKLGRTVIFDLDDLLLALPDDHLGYRDNVDALAGMLHATIDADYVVVSNSLLADIIQPLNPRVFVWPTVLPEAYWQLQPPRERTSNDTLIIGYMGGSTHLSDIAIISPLLERLLLDYPKLELHFWGLAPPSSLLNHSRVRFRIKENDSYADFVSFFRDAYADVWVAPLRSDLFNRCKSAIKFWEYTSIGGVGVYSRLDPYQAVVRDGENGLLAASLEEWDTALRSLLDNPAYRLHLAQQAQITLQKEGWVSQNLTAWEAIYRSPKPSSGEQTNFQQVLTRFSEQVQQRFFEHHSELSKIYAEVRNRDAQIAERDQRLAECHKQIEILSHRSNQLDDILQSNSWRFLQKMNRIRSLGRQSD